MNHRGMSLSRLLLAVTLVAAAIAVYQWNQPLVASLTTTASMAVLALSLVGCLVSSREHRVFWIGFAVFGWLFVWSHAQRPAANPPGTAFGQGVYQLVLLQQPGLTSQPQTQPSLLTDFLFDLINRPGRGDDVHAQWSNGTYYAGKISRVDGRRYLVAWDDGSPDAWRNRSQILLQRQDGRSAALSMLSMLVALIGAVLSQAVFGRSYSSRINQSAS